ncbi:hypothetical protein VTK73DRAFT_9215 [Phialemonium thermophilum]|uniref:BTB domain-containing protein n=1 Tax=Phialemonium thermophilum TaxID=223376 RepID=A0ABR3W405_9PEZI
MGAPFKDALSRQQQSIKISMENSGDTQTDTVVEIAPDGDLILVVGPEEAKLRVHSVFLTAVSEPFSAMLGPDWKEGRALLDSDGPAEISLPEDNAVALKIICSVIHHQTGNIPPTLAAGDILAVAVAADKYNCVRALRFASETWLRSPRDEADELMLLAAAAYLFQDALAFKQITGALVLGYDGPYLALSSEQIESAMTWRVFCLLEKQRGVARLKIADILLWEANNGTGLCPHKCGWTSKHAYAYLRLLEREQLWPADLARISISEALRLAEGMPDPTPEERSAACTYERNHAAPQYRKGRSRKLDDFVKSVGLCLRCVQSGCIDSHCREHSQTHGDP